MSSSKPALQVVPRGKPATVAEIAALEFRALKAVRGLSQKMRLQKSHAIVDGLRPMAVAAMEIVAMSKTELITKADDKHDVLGPLLMQLAYAKDDAKMLVDVIGAAEARLAIALANVEGDGR